jgi:hypothetical protein
VNDSEDPTIHITTKKEGDPTMNEKVAENITQQASQGYNLAAQQMYQQSNFYDSVLKSVTAKNLAELDSVEAAANDRIINAPKG